MDTVCPSMTDVPKGLELAFLSNLEYFRELTRSSGGTVLDQDGMTCFASPHPMPFLVSGVFRTDTAASPADVLVRARDFFGPLGRSVALSALVGRDDDVISAAVAAGFTASGDPDPLQVLGRQRLDGYDVSDIDFRTVTDDAGIAALITVCREAHASYGFPDDLFPTLFARPATVLAPHLHTVVGYDGADPVATATLFLTHGVAYVGWISVVAGQQRRGLGAAATAAVVNLGFELGARCTTLLASPMGAPVYRRLGFRDVGAVLGLEAAPERG
jgi:hypothetical protein